MMISRSSGKKEMIMRGRLLYVLYIVCVYLVLGILLKLSG